MGLGKQELVSKNAYFYQRYDHLFTPVTHIKLQINFQIYLTNGSQKVNLSFEIIIRYVVCKKLSPSHRLGKE